MKSPIEAFLARNSVAAAEGLPLVHTTRSYNVRSIMDEGTITPQQCDVFLKDSLNYFFVGRPAYKYESDASQTPHWELPCCFIFESDAIKSAKRVFPFDSGAFQGGRYPTYINSMNVESFQATELSAANKLIGAFFGTASRYMAVKPKPVEEFEAEYSIGALDAELSATSRLAGEGTISSFDDRRFTIEIQSEDELHLANTQPIAVILPEIYLSEKNVLSTIQQEWKAEPIGYPMFPLSLNAYYGLIYNEVLQLYKRRGYF